MTGERGTTPVRSHVILTPVLAGEAVARPVDAWGAMSVGHLLPFNYPGADKKINKEIKSSLKFDVIH